MTRDNGYLKTRRFFFEGGLVVDLFCRFALSAHFEVGEANNQMGELTYTLANRKA